MLSNVLLDVINIDLIVLKLCASGALYRVAIRFVPPLAADQQRAK